MIEIEFGFESPYLSFAKARESESSSKIAYVVIKNYDDVKLKDLESSSQFVKAVVCDTVSGEKEKGRIPVEVTIKPGLPLGRFNETITAKPSDAKVPSSALRISGMIVGEVEVYPEAIRFVVMDSADHSIVPSYQKVTITNHSDTKKLAIDKVVDPDGKLDLELDTLTVGQDYQLFIRPGTDLKSSNDFSGSILITTNNPDQKQVSVNYSVIHQR